VVGCERLADEKESIMVQKYQTLVALMLSVQTKD
jgi:endonuclease III